MCGIFTLRPLPVAARPLGTHGEDINCLYIVSLRGHVVSYTVESLHVDARATLICCLFGCVLFSSSSFFTTITGHFNTPAYETGLFISADELALKLFRFSDTDIFSATVLSIISCIDDFFFIGFNMFTNEILTV